MTTNTTTQEAAAPAKATRREWIGLFVLGLGAIIDIYGFFVAGALVTMGTLGDRIGSRKLLLVGAAAFGVTSLLCAFSTSPEMLIVSRAALGIAGATLAPSTLSLIFHMFQDPRQRTIAVGVWIGAFSAGSAIGPVLGGIVLEYLWWGSVFLLAV